MSQNRREFIKSSTAVTLLTVSSASAAPATRNIAILHSTRVSDQDLRCFQAGLGSSNIWQASIVKAGEAFGQYGGSHGHDVLRSFIRGKHVNLIVAAGGVSSQASASEELAAVQIPFIYMSGRAPNPPSSPNDGKFCGVILNIFPQYSNALIRFNMMGISRGDVWLIQNYNADMTAGELVEWGYNNNSFRFFESSAGTDNPDPLDDAAVARAFDQEWIRFLRLYPRPKGLIVNPDPYFRLKAQLFKSAIKKAFGNIPVCYPFNDYSPSSPDFLLPNGPALSSATTTDINNAYYQLGGRAAAVLDHLTSGPIPGIRIDSKMWNGSSWIVV
jgi:hypothetical protein